MNVQDVLFKLDKMKYLSDEAKRIEFMLIVSQMEQWTSMNVKELLGDILLKEAHREYNKEVAREEIAYYTSVRDISIPEEDMENVIYHYERALSFQDSSDLACFAIEEWEEEKNRLEKIDDVVNDFRTIQQHRAIEEPF